MGAAGQDELLARGVDVGLGYRCRAVGHEIRNAEVGEGVDEVGLAVGQSVQL